MGKEISMLKFSTVNVCIKQVARPHGWGKTCLKVSEFGNAETLGKGRDLGWPPRSTYLLGNALVPVALSYILQKHSYFCKIICNSLAPLPY